MTMSRAGCVGPDLAATARSNDHLPIQGHRLDATKHKVWAGSHAAEFPVLLDPVELA